MAAQQPIERVFQLGFVFEPTPEQMVTYYLPRLVAGEPMHAAVRPFIHRADVYACEPGVLAAHFRPTPNSGDRFFFATCKLQKAGDSSRAVRAAGPGAWHSQGNGTNVKDGNTGVKIGVLKKLRYKKDDGVYTDWLMDEFSCCGSVVGDRQYVVCKIYVSPRADPDSAAHRESAAFFAPPEKPVAVAAPKKRPAAPPAAQSAAFFAPPKKPVVVAAPKKRPAPPPAAEPPSHKRIRGAVVSTPPTVQPPCVPPPPSTTTHLDVPVIRPVQQAPTTTPPQRPSIQTVAAPQATWSPVATDPFPTAAAHDNDDDLDFAEFLEGTLDNEQAEETAEFAATEPPAAAAARDDNDDEDLDFAKVLEGTLDAEQAEEADEAEEDTEEEWFAPLMKKHANATAGEANPTMHAH